MEISLENLYVDIGAWYHFDIVKRNRILIRVVLAWFSEPFHWVMEWKDIITQQHFVSLLEKHFFSRWIQVCFLIMMLKLVNGETKWRTNLIFYFVRFCEVGWVSVLIMMKLSNGKYISSICFTSQKLRSRTDNRRHVAKDLVDWPFSRNKNKLKNHSFWRWWAL